MTTCDDYLSAEDAAGYLGVSRATLYAYVSRGLVVSEPLQGSAGRSRRYPRRVLDQLKSNRERRRDPTLSAHGALSSGAPVLDSALTLIEDGRLWYRGLDACELSRTATLEEVASLLWAGTTEHAGELFPRTASPAAGRSRRGSIADLLFASLVEARSKPAVTISGATRPALRAAARTIKQLFDAAGATGPGMLAERLSRGWHARNADDLNAALILCADHGLSASSFTARCVASTDATVGNVLLAGLCALEGRRHGGVTNNHLDELVRDVERDGVRRACRRTLSRDGWLPGFGQGSVLYLQGDPRANELLARIKLPETDALARICKFARHELDARPSLEFALTALARNAALPNGAAFGLFALGRSVGWIAHALEAAAEGKLIRPRARYTGHPPEISGALAAGRPRDVANSIASTPAR